MDFEAYLNETSQPVIVVDRIFQVLIINSAFRACFPEIQKGEHIQTYFRVYPALEPLFLCQEGVRNFWHDGKTYRAHVSLLQGKKPRQLAIARCVLLADVSETAQLLEQARQARAGLRQATAQRERINTEIRERIHLEASRSAYRETTRLLRDVHDTTGYHLLSVWSYLLQARKALPRQETARGKLQAALQNVRFAIASLSAADHGRSDGIVAFTRRFQAAMRPVGLEVVLDIQGQELEAHRNQCTHLMMICQEAAVNSVRHGSATKLYLSLVFTPGQTSLTIRDNGRAQGEMGQGFGLKNMDERANMLFGDFRYYQADDGGFVIEVVAPVVPDDTTGEVGAAAPAVWQ